MAPVKERRFSRATHAGRPEPSLEFGSGGPTLRERHLKARLHWVEQSLAD